MTGATQTLSVVAGVHSAQGREWLVNSAKTAWTTTALVRHTTLPTMLSSASRSYRSSNVFHNSSTGTHIPVWEWTLACSAIMRTCLCCPTGVSRYTVSSHQADEPQRL